MTVTFFDLPLEVRLLIYGYFGVIERGDYAQTEMTPQQRLHDIDATDEARRSLLLVNRRISREWAPFFYRTVAIYVNGGSHAFADRQYTVANFVKQFLQKAESYKLQNILAIRFDGTTLGTGRNSSDPSTQKLRSFARALRAHRFQMPLLETVQIESGLDCTKSKNHVHRDILSNPEAWSLQPAENILKQIDPRAVWNGIIISLTEESKESDRPPLQGWIADIQVEREHISSHGMVPCSVIRIVFRKHEGAVEIPQVF